MSKRVKAIENNLQVKLPLEYQIFINDLGLISDGSCEIFGYIEDIDIEKIPCVIGATKLYKKDYKNIFDQDIVISFDDLKNSPIILNTENGCVYLVSFDEKSQINLSFENWLNQTMRAH